MTRRMGVAEPDLRLDGAHAWRQLTATLPVAERRLELAGIPTRLLEGGSGDPVVLLHGPGGNAAHWMAVIPRLAPARRVVVPDLPGQGGSRLPDGGVAVEGVIDWLGELIDRTCPSAPVLVGYAVGGAIAARFAARHGDRIARLVLVDALGLVPFAPAPDFAAALHRFVAAPGDGTHDELWRQCTLDLDRVRAPMGDRWDAFRAYNVDRGRDPEVQAALGTLMEQFALPAVPDETLDRIAVPTTLIWGRGDRATPVERAQAVGERHGWPLHVLEDCGGDPPIERPDALCAALFPDADAVAPREALDGELLQPGDPGFADATLLWNARIRRTPAYVVRPTGTADVAAAVRFAGEHGLAVGVRGGGHNIGGSALPDGGLTIDMSRLRAIAVDPHARTVTVQPGCLLGEVDRATQAHGLATPLGFISEVGVTGLTLGGGLGYLTRRFGWTVDNLIEAEVVTADGAIRRAAADEHPDLLWGLRGAGANLGVVTSLTLRVHDVGPDVCGGLIAWPFARADEVLRAYRSLTASAPRELAVWMNLLRAPQAPFVPAEWQGELVCAMAVCHSGARESADEAMRPIRALADPVIDLLAERPYTDVQSYLDATEPKGRHYYWKSGYLARLDDGLLATLRELAARCPMPDAELGLLHVGGALNERAGDDGAVGNRDAQYAFGAIGMWDGGEPRADEYEAWVREAWEAVRPFSTGSSYVNFQTEDEGDQRVRDAYGANFDRLLEVKAKYDPGNVFRSNRNVAPR